MAAKRMKNLYESTTQYRTKHAHKKSSDDGLVRHRSRQRQGAHPSPSGTLRVCQNVKLQLQRQPNLRTNECHTGPQEEAASKNSPSKPAACEKETRFVAAAFRPNSKKQFLRAQFKRLAVIEDNCVSLCWLEFIVKLSKTRISTEPTL